MKNIFIELKNQSLINEFFKFQHFVVAFAARLAHIVNTNNSEGFFLIMQMSHQLVIRIYIAVNVFKFISDRFRNLLQKMKITLSIFLFAIAVFIHFGGKCT